MHVVTSLTSTMLVLIVTHCKWRAILDHDDVAADDYADGNDGVYGDCGGNGDRDGTGWGTGANQCIGNNWFDAFAAQLL